MDISPAEGSTASRPWSVEDSKLTLLVRRERQLTSPKPRRCTGICGECRIIRYDTLKRLLDVVCAGIALIVLSPFALLVSAAIWLDDPGPVLFRQQRIGRCGRTFTILKYRTMAVDCPNISTEAMMGLGRSYVTRVGALLRRTSVDELPQLWNILLGDMSFIGPRPALYTQDDLIVLRDAARVYPVRPGLTGLAQICGRDSLDLEAKVKFDSSYLERRSPWVDVSILVRTVAAVVSGGGNH